MSDAPLGSSPGSAGEMQATDISAHVGADTRDAERAVQSLGQRLVGVAQSGTRALSGIGRSLGGDNFLGPITGVLSSAGTGLDLIARKSGPAESGLQKIGRTSGNLAGVGVAIAGIGAALQTLAAPLQRSNAALSTAIQNAGELQAREKAARENRPISNEEVYKAGAAAVQQYKGQMEAAERSGAKFGYTMSDVGGALSKLTVQTKNPAEALKELNFAETLAAASGVSVSRAAEMIGRMHAGQFRYLRQFGIYIQNINTQHLSVAEATKRHADAVQRLQDAQQRLNDFEARITEARQKRTEEWQHRVQEATQKAGDAQQHYADLNQRLTDQEAYEAQKYAEDVTAANERIRDSERSLEELKQRNAAADQDRAERRQEDIENAQAAYGDASDNVRALVREQAASPASTGPEQIRQQESMKNAIDAQAKAAERLQDIQLKAVQTHEQEVSRAQELEHAEDDVAKAAQNKNQVEERHVIVQDQILAQQQEVNRAYVDSQRAAAELARITAAAAAAEKPTLAEKQEEVRLREGIAKAAEGEKAAQDKLNQSKNLEAELQKRFEQGMNQFMAREKGLLKNREDTLAGHFAKYKAMIVNFFQRDLGNIGGTAMEVGGGIAGVGYILNIGTKVTGFLKNLGSAKEGATPIVKELSGQMKLPGLAMEESAAGVAEAGPGIIASIGGLLAAIGPILLVVAAIGLVVVAGYMIVTHWKEISKDFMAGIHVIADFISNVFGGIVDFFKRWGILIIEILTGTWMIVEIVKHWRGIKDGIVRIGGEVLDWVIGLPGKIIGLWVGTAERMFNIGWNLIKGLWDGMVEIWHKFSEWFEKKLDWIRNNPVARWLLGSPSRLYHEYGRNLVQGLINGMGSQEDALGRQVDRIGDIGNDFVPKPPTGAALTGGSRFPGPSRPGNAGVALGTGATLPPVVNMVFQIEGSMVGQRELFDGWRDFMIKQGQRQGGNFLGAGSGTV